MKLFNCLINKLLARKLLLKQKDIEDYFILFLLLAITLFPLTKIWITTADDMDNFLLSHLISNPFQSGFEMAKYLSRFYNTFTYWINFIPYLKLSQVFYSFFLITPFIVLFLLFLNFISKISSNRSLSFFVGILFVSNFQILGYHSITTAYPFFYTLAFCLILLAFNLQISYYKKQRYYLIILSSVLIFIASLFYESFITYILISILIFLWKNDLFVNFKKDRVIKHGFQIYPYLVVFVVYIILYLVFRSIYPVQYWGSKIPHDLEIIKAFKTATQLGFFSLPLKSYFSHQGFLTHYALGFKTSLLSNISILTYIQSVLLMMLTIKGLWRYKNIKYKTLGLLLILGVLLYYLPLLPLALSSKYFEQGMENYTPTFLAYFGVLIFIASLILSIANLLQRNKVLKILYVILIGVSVFIVSLLTNHTNNVISRDLEASNHRFNLVKDIYSKSAISSNIPICLEGANSTTSVMGSYLLGQKFTWSKFVKRTTDFDINAYDNYNDFYNTYKDSDSILYITFFSQSIKTNDALMLFAKVKGKDLKESLNDNVSDEIILSYLSPYKSFNLSLINQTDDSVYINNSSLSKTMNYHSANIMSYNFKNKIITYTIKGEEIKISSIKISNILYDDKNIQ